MDQVMHVWRGLETITKQLTRAIHGNEKEAHDMYL